MLNANHFANASPQILLNHLEYLLRFALYSRALDDVEQRAQSSPALCI
jgi:hypothetical protein